MDGRGKPLTSGHCFQYHAVEVWLTLRTGRLLGTAFRFDTFSVMGESNEDLVPGDFINFFHSRTGSQIGGQNHFRVYTGLGLLHFCGVHVRVAGV